MINKTNPTIIDKIPGTIKAVCQLNLSIKKPANNAPKPIPKPPGSLKIFKV